MIETSNTSGAVGELVALKGGVLTGWVSLDEAIDGKETLTVEVSAQGIVFATHALASPAPGQKADFDFAIGRFPDVALPCPLRARIVETDTVLDSTVTLSGLENAWSSLVDFSVAVEDIQHNAITLKVEGKPGIAPTFLLHSWGTVVATSKQYPQSGSDTQTSYHLIPLPYTMLDGNEHRLSITHEQSGLPVSARPISLRLQIETEHTPDLSDILSRLEALETHVAKRYADAFNAVTVPLYRHIDAVTMYQRSNFEREISAMRRLLGIQDTDKTVPLPAQCHLDFSEAVVGYGVHGVETTMTGKQFRSVSAASGVLMPGIAPAPARLLVQGLRRRSNTVLDNAQLLLNGVTLDAQIYLNPKSESWNISASVSAAQIRSDRNLVELRLPAAQQANNTSGAPVSILFVSLSSNEAENATPTDTPTGDV